MIPWPGGKRRLARKLLALFPEHRCYVETFAGAGGVLFSKQPSEAEVLNDINGELVTLYRVVQHHLEELLRQFKWALVSRKMFDWCQLQDPSTLTDIQRAARFFYLQKLAFGAKVESQTFGTATTAPPRLNLMRIEEDLSAAHLRLARVTVECLPWREAVQRYDRPHTLHFMDPPYWRTEGYGVPFDLGEYDALAKTMRTMTGRSILTINDHPDMRRVFRGFRVVEMPIKYTIGGGSKAVDRVELAVLNWD